jgi:hypothetical protein
MNKRIKLELTEDQARVVREALVEYDQAVKMPDEWHKFNRRILSAITKAEKIS